MLSLIHGENWFWNKSGKSLLSLIHEKSEFWSEHNKISKISQKCKLFRKYNFLGQKWKLRFSHMLRNQGRMHFSVCFFGFGSGFNTSFNNFFCVSSIVCDGFFNGIISGKTELLKKSRLIKSIKNKIFFDIIFAI